mgnify:CR=1 FL=1
MNSLTEVEAADFYVNHMLDKPAPGEGWLVRTTATDYRAGAR